MHHESASFPKKSVFAFPKWIAGAGRKTTEVKGWGSKVLVWRLGLGWGKAKRHDLGRTSWWCFHKCRNREEWLGYGTVRTMYCLIEAVWLAPVQIEPRVTWKKWTNPKWMYWTMNCLRITLCIYVLQSLRSILCVFICMCAFRVTTTPFVRFHT